MAGVRSLTLRVAVSLRCESSDGVEFKNLRIESQIPIRALVSKDTEFANEGIEFFQSRLSQFESSFGICMVSGKFTTSKSVNSRLPHVRQILFSASVRN